MLPLRSISTLALGGVCLLVLSACANWSGIQRTAQPLQAAQLQLSAAPQSGSTLPPQWWQAFGSAQLDAWIAQALDDSPSLQVVQARLARAQAVRSGVDANGQPQVGAELDLTHQRFSANSVYPPPFGGNVFDTGQLQASASWELDFFGKNRAALQAALGQEQAAQADIAAARNLLASQVAHSYFQLLRLQAQLQIADQTVQQREALRALVQERVGAGLDTQLELRQSAQAVPQARAQREALQEQEQLAQNALAALLSKPNMPLSRIDIGFDAIKSVVIGDAVPLDLLARRADVAAAKARVLAASGEMEAARAQFLPNINLVAFLGNASIGLDQLMASGSRQWGVGPAISLPLFDAGRLRANLRAKTADLDGAIASYNATVIGAVHDAADQLGSIRSLARQQTEAAQALAHAQEAFAIAEQRQQAGLSTRLQVLAAQSGVLAQQAQLVDLQARSFDTQAQLLRALGGGFYDTSPALSLH